MKTLLTIKQQNEFLSSNWRLKTLTVFWSRARSMPWLVTVAPGNRPSQILLCDFTMWLMDASLWTISI